MHIESLNLVQYFRISGIQSRCLCFALLCFALLYFACHCIAIVLKNR